MGSNVKIHIVDAQEVRRNSLARLLYSDDFAVEIYEDISEFLASNAKSGILMFGDDSEDVELGQLIEAVKKRAEHFLLLPFAEKADRRRIVEAMRASAHDYLEWPTDANRLTQVLRHAGKAFDIWAERVRRFREARTMVETLSKREKQVIAELIRGHSNKEIARSLSISLRTAENHRANAFSKIGARMTADAVRIGIYAGLDMLKDETSLIGDTSDYAYSNEMIAERIAGDGNPDVVFSWNRA